MYQGNIATANPIGYISPTPIDRLKQTEETLKRQLEDVQAAIKALEENPDLHHVLTTLLKVNSLGGGY